MAAADENIHIARIKIEGYKSLKSVDIALRELNLLIGANGAGKSSFLSVFRFLYELVRGGLQDFVARAGGASALLHYGPKRTPKMILDFAFRMADEQNAYGIDFQHVPPDHLLIDHELFVRHLNEPVLSLDELRSDRNEASLSESSAIAESQGDTAKQIRQALEGYRPYHFHDTSDQAPVKQYASIDDERTLRGDAGNLAPFLYMLREAHPANYQAIRETIRLAFPQFDDFVLEPARRNKRQILLKWRERGSDYDFGPHQLSDGTLRFACLATLLLQPLDDPAAPRVITIDEPELGLHPYAETLLASMLKQASKRTQLIVSTQSASLLTAINDPSAVVVVERQEGASVLRRLAPAELEQWLSDYTLGELWEKGVLGGRPRP